MRQSGNGYAEKRKRGGREMSKDRKYGTWTTNALRDRAEVHEEQGMMIGPPMRTDKYSPEQLTSRGVVGIYKKPEQRRG